VGTGSQNQKEGSWADIPYRSPLKKVVARSEKNLQLRIGTALILMLDGWTEGQECSGAQGLGEAAEDAPWGVTY